MVDGEPTFEELDESALRRIGEAISTMRAHLIDCGRLRADGSVTPAMLDEAWVDLRSAWRLGNLGESAVNDAVNKVGLAFGQVLVDRFGMKWVIATDREGTDFAVRGDSGWLVYPRDFVKKRHANDESGFMTAMFETLDRRV